MSEESAMDDAFDDFARSLQNQIYEETREAYGEVAFERWLRPLYVGTMRDPDGYGVVTGKCGDRIEIFLRFEQGRVKEATFQTDECGSSTVCGSFAAELAYGKSQIAAGSPLPEGGRIFVSVCDRDKPAMIPLAKELDAMGFTIYATLGTSTAKGLAM